jgi:hypothetical protein
MKTLLEVSGPSGPDSERGGTRKLEEAAERRTRVRDSYREVNEVSSWT